MYLKYQKKLKKVANVILPDDTMTYKMEASLKMDVFKDGSLLEKGKIVTQPIEFTRIKGSELFSDSVSFIFDADLYTK